MADLASTRVFGKLTVMHEAIIKANAEIVGDITASKFIGDGSQLTALSWGQLTGVPATATRWPAWGEVTGKPAQATRWPSWSEVSSKPSTFTPSAHTHSLSQITDAGNLASLSTNASTSNFLRGDGTWVTPPNTNTTYSEITTAEIDAGTASTLRTITGRRMKHALDKKADTTTQVIAGTGLSGGGTLAANRTLSVNYGTAAGTAAQGNDSRLSNSREWTASAVTQAEAEAGTATTARKWTAQRVRQAILGWWNSSSDKTKLDGIAAGAQVNVATNLGSSGTGATRTITSSTGSNTSITYSAADVGAVPTARTITAGDGLSGGGNLTANRTLSVNYGTTAGTAAQGNDSRLSNSREWTASVVSQAEAEAGTATTARKWTAQRVRQAIAGFWYLGTDKQHTVTAATGTVALNLASASIFDLTLTGNTTLAVSNTIVPSGETRSVVVRIRQGATARTLTWWSGITWLTSSTPAAPGANKIVEYVLSYDGSSWLGRVGASN